MNIFEYEGNQYQVLNGKFYGYKKSLKAPSSIYPGDNCRVPLCMRPELSASAIASGICKDIIFSRSKPTESNSEGKTKVRRQKKAKGPSISIF